MGSLRDVPKVPWRMRAQKKVNAGVRVVVGLLLGDTPAVRPRDPALSGAALGCPQQRLSLPGDAGLSSRGSPKPLCGCHTWAGRWSPPPHLHGSGEPVSRRAAAQAGWTVQFAPWPARCVSGQIPSPLPWFPWGPLAAGSVSLSPSPELGTAPQEMAPCPLPAEGAGPGLWELGSRLRVGRTVSPGGPTCPALVLTWGVMVRRFGGEQREGESGALQMEVGRGLRVLRGQFVPCALGFSVGPVHPWDAHSPWDAPAWPSGHCSGSCDPHPLPMHSAPLILLSGYCVFRADW